MPNVDVIIQPDGRVLLPSPITLGNDNFILWKRDPDSQPFSISINVNPAVVGKVFVSLLNPINGKQEINTPISPTFTDNTQVTVFISAIHQPMGQTRLTNTDADVIIRR